MKNTDLIVGVDLAKNKKSEDYTDMLDLYVMIEEELEKIEAERVKQEKARLAREKETRRIDSLKNVWQKRANKMTLNVKYVEAFNKNNMSVFKNGEYVGIIDHLGKVIVNADVYKAAKQYDGFIVLMNDIKEPTKVLNDSEAPFYRWFTGGLLNTCYNALDVI